ncbi:MAG: RluA family pseudouridine synthase [Bacteroidetes bacterium]|nr:RluA family pseudouridine synthase [Bacteroidota bacterium]MCB9227757.1 RluA family pseudouridine synthase [Chitinophagales bacterium]
MGKIDITNIDFESQEEDDLFNVIELEADKGQNPLRIDKYVMNQSDVVSRTRVQQAAKFGNLYVNGQTVKSNYKVKPHDKILMVYPKSINEPDLTPQNIPLDIVFEDKDIIVLNKEAGLVVHPGVGNRNGTLVNGLLYHTKNLGGAIEERAGIVHRIDKNTSGLLVIAKTDDAMTHLAKQFFDRTIKRRYWALVWGDVEQDEGTIEGNIGRDQRDPKIFTVYPRGDFGKHAITHYKVIERFAYVTLVECRLETGRTHQIRVHMKHIGHTLFNDDTYGGDRIQKGTIYSKYKQFVENCFEICPRQALHAKSLGFVHPKTGKEVYFESNLPEDMLQVIEKWRIYAQDIYRKNEDL